MEVGLEVGDPLHVAMTKWGDRPHWEYDGVWLGTDDLGLWVGTPAGVRHHRPGLEFVSEVATVTLFPRERWWAATFHAPGIWCTAYVDMATPAVLDTTTGPAVVRAVDLDLDVILQQLVVDPYRGEHSVGVALLRVGQPQFLRCGEVGFAPDNGAANTGFAAEVVVAVYRENQCNHTLSRHPRYI